MVGEGSIMLVITIYLIFSMLCVMWFDATRYIIPNWLVGSLVALYPVAVMMGHARADWKMGLAAMAIVFVIGYIMFARKWMGGGDVKLLTACSLWAGMQNLLDFLFIVSLLGGIFAVGVWGMRKIDFALPKL